MSPATHPDPVGVRRPDTRLVAPAALAWAVAWWAVAAPLRQVGVGLAVAVAFLLVVAWALRRRTRGPQAPGAALTASVLVGAAGAVVLGAAAADRAARESGPLPGWAAERAVVGIAGRVSSDPRRLAPGRHPGPARFVLTVRSQEVQGRGRRAEVSAPLLVIGGSGWGGLSAGQRVRLVGRLARSSPGDDVVAVVSANGPPRRVRPGSWPWRAADRVREGLRTACIGLPTDAGALLPSLVVGDTTALPDALVDDLRTAGLSHLTAVSGANVAIVVSAVTALSTRAGATRRVRLFVAGTAVAGFVVLARPEPSVLRAAVMAGVVLVGLGAGRRARGGPVLAAAVILLLVADPWLARSPGFALSAAATGGLLWLAPPWAERLARWWPRPLAVAVAAPAAAQAACGPVLVLLTPSVSTVSVPANLLAGPAVAPATVLGVLAAVVSPVWPAAARGLVLPASVATGWIAAVAHRAAAFPVAALPWIPGRAGAVLLAAATAAVIAVTLRSPPGGTGEPGGGGRGGGGPGAEDSRAGYRIRLRAVRARPWAVVAVVVLLAAGLGWWWAPRVTGAGGGTGTGWAVALCDVGQGDALALRSGTDRAVLVDAGPRPEPVDRCLRDLGVHHLDAVLLTHFHADHVAGLPGALRGRDVGAVVVDPLAEPGSEAAAVRRRLAGTGAEVRTGQVGDGGEVGSDGRRVRWRILSGGPPAPDGGVAAAARYARAGSGQNGAAGDDSAVNDSSLVTLLEVSGPTGAVRALALGDLERPGQERLTRRIRADPGFLAGPVDVVKVAHHGSRSQDPRLYRLSGARVALVGVGADNDYGHPAVATLTALEGLGMIVMRSDRRGTVTITPTTAGLSVDARG